jgi:hypothetical protein
LFQGLFGSSKSLVDIPWFFGTIGIDKAKERIMRVDDFRAGKRPHEAKPQAQDDRPLAVRRQEFAEDNRPLDEKMKEWQEKDYFGANWRNAPWHITKEEMQADYERLRDDPNHDSGPPVAFDDSPVTTVLVQPSTGDKAKAIAGGIAQGALIGGLGLAAYCFYSACRGVDDR